MSLVLHVECHWKPRNSVGRANQKLDVRYVDNSIGDSGLYAYVGRYTRKVNSNFPCYITGIPILEGNPANRFIGLLHISFALPQPGLKRAYDVGIDQGKVQAEQSR